MGKVISIFQYDWAIQIHTVNLANVAIEKGYKVNLFLHNCSEFVCPINAFNENIKIYQYFKQESIIKKKLNGLFYKLCKSHIWIDKVDQNILEWSSQWINKAEENYFIGIEKKGLIWAGQLLQKINAKLIYYSLEIYFENPGFIEKKQFEYQRKNEIRYHKLAQFTIIQDYFRGSHLLRNNAYPNTELIYCPISVRVDSIFIGDEVIDNRKKNPIILYFGKINKHRFIDSIVKLSINPNSSFKIWLHGYCDSDYKSELLRKGDSQRLKFTDTLLPYNELKLYIKNASIGICLYRNDYCNDRLTGFSSEKIAVFLSLGIPIITFSNESTDLLFQKFSCGIGIKNIEEIETAIDNILLNYKFYSIQALNAYSQLFNFDKNIDILFNKI